MCSSIIYHKPKSLYFCSAIGEVTKISHAFFPQLMQLLGQSTFSDIMKELFFLSVSLYCNVYLYNDIVLGLE